MERRQGDPHCNKILLAFFPLSLLHSSTGLDLHWISRDLGGQFAVTAASNSRAIARYTTVRTEEAGSYAYTNTHMHTKMHAHTHTRT